MPGASWSSREVAGWERRGRYRRLLGSTIFTMDVPPKDAEENAPLLVLHGFPTCSFDFHLVVDDLATTRRVLLLDMLGYGLSDKPDIPYTLAHQADLVQAFVADAGVSRLSMLTHDMGDTVGGELLARHAEGAWDVDIVERVVTNGSVYIEMANLSAGQLMLLGLPDARLEDTFDLGAPAFGASLAATFSPHATVDACELEAAWELVAHHQGHLLLPRTIRYIEERRRHQGRYTGAIENHPSPLTIVWGTDDPIALADMASRLHETRPDSELTWLTDVGHYLMLEAPGPFVRAVEAGLRSN